MNTHELLACMDRLGVRLSREAKALHVDAPCGVLTQELRDELAVHKAELLALPEVVLALISAPWPPRPAELAGWPECWREKWGELANDLEDLDLEWNVSERQAFIRIALDLAAQEAEHGPVERAESVERSTDADVAAAIAGIIWDGRSLVMSIEEARRGIAF